MRHVVEPPLRLGYGRFYSQVVLDFVSKRLDYRRQVLPARCHRLLENRIDFLGVQHSRPIIGFEGVDVVVVFLVQLVGAESSLDVVDDAKSALYPQLLHSRDDLLVGHKDLPDRGLFGLADSAVHPVHKPLDQLVVEFHFHEDVHCGGVQQIAVVVEESPERFLGVEEGVQGAVGGPVGQLVKRLVRQLILVDEERLCARTQHAQVQDGHVAFSLDAVEQLADLHTELHGVLSLQKRKIGHNMVS